MLNIPSMMNTKYISIILGLFIIAFSFYVQSSRYDQSIISIHDNLDSNIIYFKLLKDSELFYSNGNIDLTGPQNRNKFASQYSIVAQLYNHFKILDAYFLVILLKMLIAFIGMRLLLVNKPFFIDPVLATGISTLFALLPGHPATYLSQASIPLCFYLLFRVSYSENPREFLTWAMSLVLVATLSSLFLHGFFICVFASVYAIFLFFHSKKQSIKLIFGLALLSLAYLAVEYRLILESLNPSEASLREDFGWGHTQRSFLELFTIKYTQVHYHCEAVAGPLLYRLIPLLLLFYIFKDLFANKALRNTTKVLLITYIIIIISASFSALAKTNTVLDFINSYLSIFKGFNFSRFNFLNSTFWYIALALSLQPIYKNYFKLFVFFILALQLKLILLSDTAYNDFKNNYYYDEYIYKHLNFQEFYSPALFNKIKTDINYKNEYAVAVGYHPAILQYNNIKTLDGYFSLGTLSYKKAFREIIAPQLEVNDKFRRYYDNWGARMYVFSDEAHYNYKPKRQVWRGCPINKLKINPDALKDMGGVYLFSRCEILNAGELGIGLVNTYKEESSPYRIFLYTTENHQQSK